MAIVSKYIDGCGILGILRRNSSGKVPGDLAVLAMQPAKPRGAGLGAGFAVFRSEGGPMRLGVFSKEDYLDQVVKVVEGGLSMGGFKVVDVRVRARVYGIVDLEYVVDGVGDISGTVHGINNELWRSDRAGRVYFWSRYVCIECLSLIMEGARELGVVNRDAMSILNEDLKTLDWLGIGVGPSDYESRKHELYAQLAINSLKERKYDNVRKYLVETARIRGFLG